MTEQAKLNLEEENAQLKEELSDLITQLNSHKESNFKLVVEESYQEDRGEERGHLEHADHGGGRDEDCSRAADEASGEDVVLMFMIVFFLTWLFALCPLLSPLSSLLSPLCSPLSFGRFRFVSFLLMHCFVAPTPPALHPLFLSWSPFPPRPSPRPPTPSRPT